MKIQPVSMADIARVAGVSKNTVSAALRNHPSISRATCNRVQNLARKMGYRPNPMVSALMAQVRYAKPLKSAGAMGYLCGVDLAWTLREPNYARFLDGARSRAAELGYSLDLFSMADEEFAPPKLARVLQARGITGLVLGTVGGDFSMEGFPWDRFAVAAIGFGLRYPAVHRATNDQAHAMRTAMAELLQRGFSRPGFAIDIYSEDRVEGNWLGAYLQMQATLPRANRIPACELAVWCRENFLRWFNRHRPDVVLTVSDDVTAWLRSVSGRRVPVAHLNLMPRHKSLMGIRQDYEAVGAATVDLVDMQLKRNERGLPPVVKHVVSRGHWVGD